MPSDIARPARNIDMAALAQQAARPHVSDDGPSNVPPIQRGNFGEAIAPLKEFEGESGVVLSAGPVASGGPIPEQANILVLGGKKYSGRVAVGEAGASLRGLVKRGKYAGIVGDNARFTVAADGRTDAYFGLGPALLGSGDVPQLAFLSKEGKLRSTFSDGMIINQILLAASAILGGRGFGEVPERDGYLSLSDKRGEHDFIIQAAKALLEARDYAAHFASIQAASLDIGGATGAHGAITVRNAGNQPSVIVNGETGDIQLANADCAEEFDIDDNAEMAPGSVAVMSASGLLDDCREAYDTRVVGVVSGAGAYRPGLVLDRRAKEEGMRRRLPIAMMGKVFCKVDARDVPVAAGDLLTTSKLSGHAMAVPRDQRERAHGAVIGKALAPLETGTGLLPMLVCAC